MRKIRKVKRQDVESLNKPMENIEGLREEEVEIQLTSGESVPQPAPPMEKFERALRHYALPPSGIPPVIR